MKAGDGKAREYLYRVAEDIPGTRLKEGDNFHAYSILENGIHEHEGVRLLVTPVPPDAPPWEHLLYYGYFWPESKLRE